MRVAREVAYVAGRKWGRIACDPTPRPATLAPRLRQDARLGTRVVPGLCPDPGFDPRPDAHRVRRFETRTIRQTPNYRGRRFLIRRSRKRRDDSPPPKPARLPRGRSKASLIAMQGGNSSLRSCRAFVRMAAAAALACTCCD